MLSVSPWNQRLNVHQYLTPANPALSAPGYITFMWNTVMQWPKNEMHMNLVQFRKELRNRGVHAYIHKRIIVARKPERPS